MALFAIAAKAGMEGANVAIGGGAMVQAQNMFDKQQTQTKRYFAATWAESSWRHGEALAQVERQHKDSIALQLAGLHRNERIYHEEFVYASMHEKRAYLLNRGAEVRDALRDTIVARVYEYNNIMLCDTVCAGVSFALVIEGSLPDDPAPSARLLATYTACVGLANATFILSIATALIVTRRLNARTASELEVLFNAASVQGKTESAKSARSLAHGVKISATYDAMVWFEGYLVEQSITTMGWSSRLLMLVGMLFLMLSAGLLIHGRFDLIYKSAAPTACFWAVACVALLVILFLEHNERNMQKQKKGVYTKEDYQFQHEEGTKVTEQLEDMEAEALNSMDTVSTSRLHTCTARACLALTTWTLRCTLAGQNYRNAIRGRVPFRGQGRRVCQDSGGGFQEKRGNEIKGQVTDHCRRFHVRPQSLRLDGNDRRNLTCLLA
jgi:hypothetical protein